MNPAAPAHCRGRLGEVQAEQLGDPGCIELAEQLAEDVALVFGLGAGLAVLVAQLI
jgi:hypothetical protein